MYNFVAKIFDRLDRGLSPRDKLILVILLFAISVLGIVLAVRYYNYIQRSPEFCNSCHLMEDAYRAWKTSRHNHIVCQDCHQLGLLEQNRLLIKFVFTTDRSTPEPHGAETPWKTCTRCHWEEASQGSLTVKKSRGHARHVFMEKLSCVDCHSRKVHAFRPDKQACLRCHKDWKVHGIGMERVSCMTCHPFAAGKEGTFIPDRERCLSCHRNLRTATFPSKAPMARLNCYECHRPHTRIRPLDEDCLRCHTREVLARKSIHQTTRKCVSCHVPHRWIAE